MNKSPDAFRTISEVAEALETPAHVLRFWETRFPQIKPVKRAGGRRYYRPADVALLSGIKRLLHEEGLTIRGVQKILREQGTRHVSGLTEDGSGDELDLAAVLTGRDGDDAAHIQTDAEEEERGVILPFRAAEQAEAQPELEPEAPLEGLSSDEGEAVFSPEPEPALGEVITEASAEPAGFEAESFSEPAEEEIIATDLSSDDFTEEPAEEPAEAPFEEPEESVSDSAPEPAAAPVSPLPPLRQPDLFAQAAEPEPAKPAAPQPAPATEHSLDSAKADQDDGNTTLAARLRALPLGAFAAKQDALLEIAARLAALRDRMGGLPPRS